MLFDLRFPSFFYKQRLNAAGIPMLCGVLLFLLLPNFSLPLLLLCSVALLVLLFFRNGEERKILACAVIGLSFSMILCGITSLSQIKSERLSEQNFSAEGKVIFVSEEYFDLSLSRFNEKKASFLLRCRGEGEVLMGDRIRIEGKASSALSDSDRQDAVFLLCEVEKSKPLGKDSFFSFVGSLRADLSEHFGEGRVGAFLKAILLGDRSALSSETNADFQKIASSHLLAISGLHITRIIGFLLVFLRLIGLPKRFSRWILIPLIFILFFFAGAGVSAFRASVMMLFVVISALFYRRSDSVTALIFAACLVVIRSPYAFSDLSFLFSFSSTFAILSCVSPLSDSFLFELMEIKTGPKKNFIYIAYSIFFSFLIASAVFVFNLPIQLLFFGTANILSPLYALILIPVFGFCLLLALLYAALAFLPFSVPVFPDFCRGTFSVFLDWVSAFAAASPDPLQIPFAPAIALFLFAFLLFALFFRWKITVIFKLYFVLIVLFFVLSLFL